MNILKLGTLSAKSINFNISKKDLDILRIISKGNDLQLKLLMYAPENIPLLIKNYYERKPVIDDLNKNEVAIDDIDYLLDPKFEKFYEKSIPILLAWLINHKVSEQVKVNIVHVLGLKKSSKKKSFQIILKEYKEFIKQMDQKNKYNQYNLMLGNALLNWVDDTDIDLILNLLKDDKLVNSSYILKSLLNFKSKESKKKVLPVLKEIIENPGIDADAKQFAKQIYSKFAKVVV